MYQNDALKSLIKNARLSYCALTEPRAPQNGGEAKYSVTLLIPKTDVATKADIDASIRAAMAAGRDKTWKGVMPPQPHIPIHDGDGVRESGEPYGEECKGCWIVTASSKQKPEVVDSTLNPIINASDIYSGMYAHVTVRFFAYANSGNKGIGCGLGNVMKTADGEPLGGHTNAATDFADIAQPVSYPAYAQQPTAAQAYPTNIQAQDSSNYPRYQQQIPTATAVDPITGQPLI